jgi:hypothetical protein
MHGGDSLAVVKMGERHRKGRMCLGFSDWGFGRRMTRGMFDMGRKYLVPVGYNDEVKKLFMMIVRTISMKNNYPCHY